MFRKLIALAGLSALAAMLGCAMCQDCLDDTGPVPDSPNYGDFEHSPRAGSVTGTTTEGPEMQSGDVVYE